ncbi:MAG: PHP domain-containing protein [Candidatus Hydrogenedentes bacterium]|nr:PHP domain-containing protein [Candidatus Hydrogenedentota bacterium]
MVDLHIHSTYSDGEDEPETIIETAIGLGMEHICITDHVTACTPWLDDYVRDIRALARKYRNHIDVLCGFESKVIDLHGQLDALDEFYEKVDLVFGAFHDIPTENGLAAAQPRRPSSRDLSRCWFESFCNLIANPHVHIIAHPTAVLGMYGLKLSRTRKLEIARRAKRYDIALERNSKYGVPDAEFVDILGRRGVRLTRGSDSHNVAQFTQRNAKRKNRD